MADIPGQATPAGPGRRPGRPDGAPTERSADEPVPQPSDQGRAFDRLAEDARSTVPSAPPPGRPTPPATLAAGDPAPPSRPAGQPPNPPRPANTPAGTRPTGSPPAQPRRADARPQQTVERAQQQATKPAAQSQKARTLIESGISGLDAQFGGGLPAGNTVLVLSEPLDAPTLFAEQYAAQGLKGGERVYYFSLNRSAEVVRNAVARHVDNPETARRLEIIDGSSLQFKGLPRATRQRLNVESDLDPMDLLEGLLEDETLKAPFRIVVDSVTDLADHYEKERIFRTMRLLHALVGALGGSCLLLMVEPLHEAGDVAAAQHIADGVIQFRLERHGAGGIVPFMIITRMKGIVDPQRMLRFKETDNGLWLESTQRVQ